MLWGSVQVLTVVMPNVGVKLFTPWGEAGALCPLLNVGCSTEGGIYGGMCLSLSYPFWCAVSSFSWWVGATPRWGSGRESAWNAGDLGSIPRSGRTPGGGNGNPLQYSGLENPMDRRAWQATVHGVAESDTTEHTHTGALSCFGFFFFFWRKLSHVWLSIHRVYEQQWVHDLPILLLNQNPQMDFNISLSSYCFGGLYQPLCLCLFIYTVKISISHLWPLNRIKCT